MPAGILMLAVVRRGRCGHLVRGNRTLCHDRPIARMVTRDDIVLCKMCERSLRRGWDRFARPRIVYLLHFDRSLAHARHYLGSTDDLELRKLVHGTKNGPRILRAARLRGITWVVARTWMGDRYLERRLKKRGGASRLCPICKQSVMTDEDRI